MVPLPIAHYKIISKLGEGGMGEVYRATDTKLGRDVAIKVIPEAFAQDADRMARFAREAQVLAALNHPNIAAIYGVEESALVLELVEGPTLAERTAQGPMPVEEALPIARQVAEAVEYAHERGVIHRDLKPANIKLTPQGRVKVLDFGLAKLTEQGQEGVTALTQTMAIAGTPGYLAPEQLQGKAADARSDIFAFGCVLYELLSGRRAFPGNTLAASLASTAMAEPKAIEGEPKELERLVLRCLRKDPGRRIQHMGDVRIALEEIRDAPEPKQRSARRRRLPIAAACVAAAALLALIGATALVTRRFTSTPAANVVRTTIALPAGTQMPRRAEGPYRTELALSPDGRYLVFSAGGDDGSPLKARLYLRALDKAEAVPVAGAEGARNPFFSPDGQWVGFWARGKLQKVSLAGGIPVALCNLSEPPMGAAWGTNGRIILGSEKGGLRTFDAADRSIRDLTTTDPAKEGTHRLPNILPGGRAVLFTVMPHLWGTRGHIEALSLDSGRRKVLVEDGMDARYAPTGHLVYVHDGMLLAVPFDADRLEVRGAAVPVVEGVQQAINSQNRGVNSGAGQYGFSDSGALVYASGGVFPDSDREMFWVDRQGRAEPVKSFGRKPVAFFRLSPDGRKMAFESAGRNWGIWVHDLVRGTSSKLTSEEVPGAPAWTPDGNRIVFESSTAGPRNIFWMPWDGSGPAERLTTSKNEQWPASWSPDGRLLAFVEGGEGSDVFLLHLENRRVTPFLNTQYAEAMPEFSPDGRWLAYTSNESGRSEVYVTPVPGPGRRTPISVEGGTQPLWARDGRELFYWSLDVKNLMVVDTVLQPDLRAGSPRVLFEFQGRERNSLRGYDVSPDGRRFLIPGPVVIKPVEVTQLNLVLNWFEELKRLAPSDKPR